MGDGGAVLDCGKLPTKCDAAHFNISSSSESAGQNARNSNSQRNSRITYAHWDLGFPRWSVSSVPPNDPIDDVGYVAM